jgi:hypothetical protein
MSSSKKFDMLSDFAAGVYLSEAQNPIPPHLTHRIGGAGESTDHKTGMKIPTGLNIRKKSAISSL